MGSSLEASKNASIIQQPHAFVFPYPVQGHIQPFMRLSKLLATDYGFLISFFNSEESHVRLTSAPQDEPPSQEAQGKLPDMRMLFLPDKPPSPPDLEQFSGTYIEMSHLAISKTFLNTDVAAVEALIRSQTPPVTCLIFDCLVTSIAPHLAQNLGLPMFILFTASAASLARAIQSGQANATNEAESFAGKGMWSFFARPFTEKLVNQNDTVLINTSEGLEGSTLERLKEEGNKVYAIGPLLPAGGSIWPEDNSCLAWLDAQPAASVLFVSFGTSTSFSATQLLELGLGLEASNQRVLWVIRPDFIHGKAPDLPFDFLVRIKDRVFITSWVPQMRVLAHPSVGGFLSHCGWNSTIESIASGIPILAWPSVGDQFANANFVVHTWRIGLPLLTQESGLITQAHVEGGVRDLMEGEIGKEMRERAQGLKESMRSALLEGGSSSNNLHRLFGHA